MVSLDTDRGSTAGAVGTSEIIVTRHSYMPFAREDLRRIY